MLGHIRIADKGRRVDLELEKALGLPLLTAVVPLGPKTWAWTSRRRMDKAARLLVQQGIRRVLVPEGFDRWDQLRAHGLIPVDPVPFCQALAAPLVLAELNRRGIEHQRATVALRGSRVTNAFHQAAETLAPLVRGIVVLSPNGGEALSVFLRREFGVPILEENRADLTIDFTPVPGNPADLSLHTTPDLGQISIDPVEGAWPPGFELLPLAAALWEGGALHLSELLCL